MTDQKSLILKLAESIKRAADDPQQVFSLAAELQGRLTINPHEEAIPDISRQVEEALLELEADIQHRGKKDRLLTGLVDLDKLLNICKGEMLIISGESSQGKTALAMNIVEETSIVHRKPSLVFSIEMPSKQLIYRMMASQARVDVREATRTGDQELCKKLNLAATAIRQSPIHIFDDPDVTDLTIRSKARQMVEEKDIQLIVVDYLQIVSSNGQRDGTDASALSERAMSFKRMAKELNVPVIVLSQEEETTGKTYGSRAPRHHTDNLLRIKPGYIFIDKQRNGPRDRSVPVTFVDKWTRFENAAPDDEL